MKKKSKKILLAAVALALVAAIGVGIFLGTRGSGDPVNVYPFDYVGMSEYWGDSQDSSGPVSTDKIQTVYLSATQTVTEVLVSEGDEVKEGDVLMTFDTTLTELELERKRLEVEKQKLELNAAQARLRDIRYMVPMDPDAIDAAIPAPTEPVLGDKISGNYEISKNTDFDGSAVEKYLILWLKDGQALNSDVLRLARQAAADYQQQNAGKPASSASGIPEDENGGGDTPGGDTPGGGSGDGSGSGGGDTPGGSGGSGDGSGDTPGGDNPGSGNDGSGGSGSGNDGSGGDENPGGDPPTPVETTGKVEVAYICNGQTVDTATLDVGPGGYNDLSDACTYQGKTYWLTSATGANGRKLGDLSIPGYPQGDPAAQAAWEATWSQVTLNYIRNITLKCDQAESEQLVLLTPQKQATFCFSAYMEHAPGGGSWTWKVSPREGSTALTQTENGSFLILSGEPGDSGVSSIYDISAVYTFNDRTGTSRAVEQRFQLATMVGQAEQVGKPVDDFYMVLKVTEDDMSRGNRLIWQGLHVFCYKDGSYGFALFDASVLDDHTLEPLEEPELPEIDFGSGFTAVEIAKMRVEQEKEVKKQQLALDMAQAEFNIMQAEVEDGTVRAEFDGQVVSVLTEDEARQNNSPLLKVSAGGGYYVECSVGELHKDNLRIGQEVTVNDWNTGSTYTGTISAIGEFPVEPNGWSSADNQNVSYYPFTVFVDSTADLQAWNYVGVTYASAEEDPGVYLQNAFIRTEGGRSYAFVEGADGRLEKRYLTIGRSLYGSYTQVFTGVTAEDHVAFPYGKTVKEGAPAVQSDDISSLYRY